MGCLVKIALIFAFNSLFIAYFFTCYKIIGKLGTSLKTIDNVKIILEILIN